MTESSYSGRMRLRRRRRRGMGVFGFSFAPLLDVILLLVIFLLVAANFDKRHVVPVELPKAGGQEMGETKIERIVIVLHRDGRIEVNGRVMNREQLASSLKALPAEERLRPIVIQGDQNATLGDGVTLFALLNDLGFKDFVVETLPVVGGGKTKK